MGSSGLNHLGSHGIHYFLFTTALKAEGASDEMIIDRAESAGNVTAMPFGALPGTERSG